MSDPAVPASAKLDTIDDDATGLWMSLSGRLEARTVSRIWARGRKTIQDSAASLVVIDAGGVDYCDSAGAAMLVDLRMHATRRGGNLELESFPERYRPVLDLMWTEDAPAAPPPKPSRPRNVPEQLGRRVVDSLRELRLLTTALGEVVAALVWAGLHPGSIRWKETFRVMQSAGVNAFFVVFVVNFLIGLILAYQTAGIFRQYGADVLMADMLGLSIVRELAPLMTAIMVTARSGSAFAAEIGTMKVNEEVDALTTMGLDPVRFLAIPRIIAAVLMVPLLTIFANLAGLSGGVLVWINNLGLSLTLYRLELANTLGPADLLGGLGKSVVFGMIVASIGCIRGMQTKGGAIAVGTATTSAVVSGIVLIVLADMVFSVLFFYLGI